MRLWIVVVLGTIFFGSMALLVLLFPNIGDIRTEIAKALLQLGVVAVAGAVVSVLVFEYQRERQTIDKQAELDREIAEKKADIEREANEKQRDLDRKSLEYRESLLLSILARAMDSYGRTKKARRLLRGRAILNRNGEKIVLANQYDVCFDLLNGAQLDLENIARDVKTSWRAFSTAAVADKTVDDLRKMDSYLNDLIGEYEDSRNRFSGQEPSLHLSELSFLQDFLQPARMSNFKDAMVVPYHDVQWTIRKELMHPNLPGGTDTSKSNV
ncbi:MAG TPA: hypothetical protein VFZ23_17850 [Pyrinomonadaceae bacterium]